MNRAQRRRAAKKNGDASLKSSSFSQSDMKTIETVLLAANRQIDAGDFDKARTLCEGVINAAPRLPEAHFALGTVFQESNAPHDAITAYDQAIKFRPNYFDAWVNKANCHNAVNQSREAVISGQKAVRLKPDSSVALAVTGSAHSQLHDHDNAVDCLTKAAKIDRESNGIRFLLAKELRLVGQHREAVKHLEQVTAAQPKWAEPFLSLGVCLQEMGEFSRAKTALEQALALEPGSSQALMALVQSDTGNDTAETVLRKTDGLLASDHTSPEQQAECHFTNALIYERKNDPETAFSHYRRGNEINHLRLKIDQTLYRDRFEKIAETFDRALIERLAGHGSKSRKPVFIVGMPRSGTSLIEQILSAHPDVFGAGELDEMMLVTRALQSPEIEGDDYLKKVTGLKKPEIREMFNKYLSVLDRRSNDEARVVDKAPLNFMRLGMISILFPDAAIIHARRGAMDTCLSCYFQMFSMDLHPYTYDFGDLGFYFQHYRQLMDHWRDTLPKPFLDVDYEALVNDPEPVVRKMLDFCGLDWNDACLASHEVDRPVATASLWQVRQPIYKTSSGKWHQYEAHIGALKDALGPYGDETANADSR